MPKNLQKSIKNLQENEFVVSANSLCSKLKNTISSAIPGFCFSIKGKENVNIYKITNSSSIFTFFVYISRFLQILIYIFTNSYKFFIEKNSFFLENYKFFGDPNF